MGKETKELDCAGCGIRVAIAIRNASKDAKCSKCRFFDKIKKLPTGCWEWIGARTFDGYGQFYDGKKITTHRYSYQIHKGKIPKGMLVCHTCDNPPCCNPDHLFLGTRRDNVVDMIRKSRGNSQKLSMDKARKIRYLFHEQGYTYKELVDTYHVSERSIKDIIIGKTYRED